MGRRDADPDDLTVWAGEDGTVLVEGGRIVGPVRNLRFTESYLDVLAGVDAVSRERRCVRGFLGGSVVPAVRVSSFTFTGVTADG